MDWLKRNLFIVIGSLVALGLLGFAGYYLYSNIEEEAGMQKELDEAGAELQKLHTANPTPNATNIALVKADLARLAAYIADARKHFAAPTEAKIDNAAFKKLLEDTIFELSREAEAARVALPKNYPFTFKIQREAVRFSPGSLEVLVARMEEIKTLSRILYAARVHSLDVLRRVTVSADDTEGSAEFLLQKPQTNAALNMVQIPYEVTFTGFSAQMASVLDGLLRTPQFFVVRNLTVEAAPIVGSGPGTSSGVTAAVVGTPSPGGEGGAPPPSVPVFTAPANRPGTGVKSGPVTLLDEKLLRITMLLDVINPLPAPPAASGAPSK